MKKIITYNVNGIRAASSKGLIDWLEVTNADIVCFQELKANLENIPVLEFQSIGYNCYWYPAQKKGYSGVALLSKTKPDNVFYGMGIQEYDFEGRFIRADFGEISIVSVYHPSGSSGEERQSFKMLWLERFLVYINELRKTRPNIILCGDFNICHKSIDIHDPIRNAKSSGFLPEEREWMDRFTNSGFVDSFRAFNDEPRQYSWWSYRSNAREKNLGWRIDYNFVSKPLENIMSRAVILPDARHSDHCPCVLEIDF